MSIANPSHHGHSKSWLIFSGILSLVLGFLAISFPYFFSLIVTQVIGIFCLVSGFVSLGLAISGKKPDHRILNGIAALIRIGVGVALLLCAASGMKVITLIFAVFLILEGIVTTISAFRLRGHGGWGFFVFSGVIALVLGVMIYFQWPANTGWVIGTFYGINSIFSGVSLLGLGFGAPKASA
ncbi:hypothetical protein TSACC_21665 [Terrimicrobium sacchariphilum]|jgi:uncharacterized membrane protein HdeD (DUF308 family)|uniref:Acid-resistance membrane protein n=1 Tax=Terrimicrobium sacchariphilum TaxID=690879 RepID=A0A146G7B8_TERSA|nr:HdeD family acid-resistance protein [Terrimicrobium sacchariphilum]GAT33253.1 hypothetical protein TSACC_21665 [Terrimicrobium sacchariphilum]